MQGQEWSKVPAGMKHVKRNSMKERVLKDADAGVELNDRLYLLHGGYHLPYMTYWAHQGR